MKYSDLANAMPEHVLALVRRDEKLAQLHNELVTEVCIEKGKFEYENMDNPAQVGNFHRENLSDKAKTAYLALGAELKARYAISLPDPGE